MIPLPLERQAYAGTPDPAGESSAHTEERGDTGGVTMTDDENEDGDSRRAARSGGLGP